VCSVLFPFFSVIFFCFMLFLFSITFRLGCGSRSIISSECKLKLHKLRNYTLEVVSSNFFPLHSVSV
jgi:hypothetical protein